MDHHDDSRPRGFWVRIGSGFEETVIAVLLGLMTIITFINVVLRYIFTTSLIWGLEATLVLFAWLVLFGISYGFKVRAHLGVDAVLNIVGPDMRRVLSVLAALLTLIYALLLMKGGWDYWANFANLPQTTGRAFPTGLEEMNRSSYRAYYETEQIPFPGFLSFLNDAMNDGEPYRKLPRFIPYAILPIGMALLVWRVAQAVRRVVSHEGETLIVSHEAEDAVDQVAALNREE